LAEVPTETVGLEAKPHKKLSGISEKKSKKGEMFRRNPRYPLPSISMVIFRLQKENYQDRDPKL